MLTATNYIELPTKLTQRSNDLARCIASRCLPVCSVMNAYWRTCILLIVRNVRWIKLIIKKRSSVNPFVQRSFSSPVLFLSQSNVEHIVPRWTNRLQNVTNQWTKGRRFYDCWVTGGVKHWRAGTRIWICYRGHTITTNFNRRRTTDMSIFWKRKEKKAGTCI